MDKKGSIIIFFEHISREYEACEQLAQQLTNKYGYQVKLFSIVFTYCEAVRYSRSHKIDAVFFPWIYNDWDYALTVPFLKCNPSIVIVNLHQEQIASDFSDSLLLPKGKAAKNGCYHIAWGKQFKERLIRDQVNSNLILVTGSIRADLMSSQKPTRTKNQLADQYNLSLNKKWILYAENRDWVRGFGKNQARALASRGASNSAISDRLIVTRKALSATEHQMKCLPDSFFNSYELIYRPHPGTTGSRPNNRIHVIDDYSINTWLNSVDLVLIWDSTTAFEAEVAGVPVVRHEAIDNPKEFRTYGIEKFPVIKSLDAIPVLKLGDLERKQAHQAIYKNYLGACDGNAAEYMSEIIFEILTNNQNQIEVVPTVKYRYRLFRRLVFEKITRILSKLNLINILKKPRIAYQLKNDIPY